MHSGSVLLLGLSGLLQLPGSKGSASLGDTEALLQRYGTSAAGCCFLHGQAHLISQGSQMDLDFASAGIGALWQVYLPSSEVSCCTGSTMKSFCSLMLRDAVW